MNIQKCLMIAFSVLPAIIIASVYKILPQDVVIHWNIDGSVDYGDKKMLLLLAIFPILLAILFVMVPKMSKDKERLIKFNNEYYALALSIIILMLGITIMTILKSFNLEILSFPNVICFCLAMIFATEGNIMLKDTDNKFVGIKNRYTKRDDLIWKKTNRLAGKIFILGGLVQAIAAIFAKNRVLFIIIVSIIALDVIIPNIMSHIWYKKYHK